MSDKVTPEVHRAVLVRDHSCVAFVLDPSHICRDVWGNPHSPYELHKMTLDHVRDEPMMGKRAPSTPSHLVTLCYSAHIASGWATSHRPALRDYLREHA